MDISMETAYSLRVCVGKCINRELTTAKKEHKRKKKERVFNRGPSIVDIGYGSQGVSYSHYIENIEDTSLEDREK